MQLKDLLDIAYQTEGLITLIANSPDNDPERIKYLGQLVVEHADRLAAAAREHFDLAPAANTQPLVEEIDNEQGDITLEPETELVDEIIEEDFAANDDSEAVTLVAEDERDREIDEEVADNLLFKEEAYAAFDDNESSIEDDFMMDIVDATAPVEEVVEPEVEEEPELPIEESIEPELPEEPVVTEVSEQPDILVESDEPEELEELEEPEEPIETVEEDREPTIHGDAPVNDLNTAMSRFRGAKNFTQTFPLNDRYCFTRELFGNSQIEFKSAADLIDAMRSPDEVDEYFINDLGWDAENEVVQQFISLARNYIADK